MEHTNSALRLCVHLPGRYRTAIYTRSTTRRPHTAVQHTIDSYLQQTVFRTPAVRSCRVRRSRTRTVHFGCLYTNFTYLGDPVAHCTRGVRIQDHTRQFTTPYTAICSELNFRAHALLICTAPRSRTRTVHLGCVYTNYNYLGGPVAHCAPGARL